ncbi:MAG: hypothetical protein KGK16_01370, partial [Bradyrhizobium sp.]|nr:hypothetical protein [Bradyrhizobium sp.]
MDRRKRAKTGKIADMAHSFAASRHARFALALPVLFSAFCFSLFGAASVQAQDAPPSADHPSTTAGQKPSEKSSHANVPAGSSAAEQHRLPPDSITKHTIVLPGRTLAFTATAGSIRLF